MIGTRTELVVRGAAALALLLLASCDGSHHPLPQSTMSEMHGSGGGGMGGGGGGTGGGGGGGGMGGGGVIDPPPGAAFKDPLLLPNLSSTPGEFHGALEARPATVNVNGTPATLLTYNGSFPGPTIRVRHGDRLRIDFKNGLPATQAKNILGFVKNHTNIHTHGLHVSPREPADAAHIDIPPAAPGVPGTYAYDYDLREQRGGSVNFYHGHVHGVSAEQYWGGMIGAIVVEDDVNALAAYETHLMVLKDLTLSNGAPAPYASTMEYMRGKEGELVMVNGQVNPVLAIRPGQVQRWRILNGSNARFYKLSLAGHTFHLVGTDGGLLDKPYAVSTLLLSPGERVDVLIKAASKGTSSKLLALPYSRMGMMQSAQITLLTLSYAGARTSQSLPATVDPAARRVSMDLGMLPHKSFTLSMSNGRGLINGQDWDVDPYMFMSDLNRYEVWEIHNASNMDHPWHQHVNSAQVLSITGGDAGYAALYTAIPAWKDVVLVPKMGSVTLLVPVMHYSGMTMAHCHILEHEDIGMMAMWHIMDPMGPMDPMDPMDPM